MQQRFFRKRQSVFVEEVFVGKIDHLQEPGAGQCFRSSGDEDLPNGKEGSNRKLKRSRERSGTTFTRTFSNCRVACRTSMLAWTCWSANTAARLSEQRETATDHHLYGQWRSHRRPRRSDLDKSVAGPCSVSCAPSHKSHNSPQIHLPAHWRNLAARDDPTVVAEPTSPLNRELANRELANRNLGTVRQAGYEAGVPSAAHRQPGRQLELVPQRPCNPGAVRSFDDPYSAIIKATRISGCSGSNRKYWSST
jgi:hypothetical protein